MSQIEYIFDFLKKQSEMNESFLVDKLYGNYSSQTKDTRKALYDYESFFKSFLNADYKKDRFWQFENRLANYSKRLGKYRIQKNDEYKLISPDSFLAQPNQNNKDKFTVVDIFHNPVLEQNGWYFINGDKILNEFSINRIAFSINLERPDSCISFFRNIIDTLNNLGVPFNFKIEKKLSDRLDNAILYFQRDQYLIIFYLLKIYYTNECFRNVNYIFQKELLRGVGFCEEEELIDISFGKNRSKVMVKTFLKNTNCVLDDYKKSINSLGYNLEEFYRNPNENFPYNFEILKCDIALNIIPTDQKNSEILIKILKLLLQNSNLKSNEIYWLIGEIDNPPIAPILTTYRKSNEHETKIILEFIFHGLMYLCNDYDFYDFKQFFLCMGIEFPQNFQQKPSPIKFTNKENLIKEIKEWQKYKEIIFSNSIFNPTLNDDGLLTKGYFLMNESES